MSRKIKKQFYGALIVLGAKIAYNRISPENEKRKGNKEREKWIVKKLAPLFAPCERKTV